MTITLTSRVIWLVPLMLMLLSLALGSGLGVTAAGQSRSESTTAPPVLLIMPDNTQVLRGTYTTEHGVTIRYRLTRTDADRSWIATDPDNFTVLGLARNIHPDVLRLRAVKVVLTQYNDQRDQRE